MTVDDALVNDTFFANVVGFEQLVLANGDGSDSRDGSFVVLGAFAYEAGIHVVQGGNGDDVVVVGTEASLSVAAADSAVPDPYDEIGAMVLGGGGSDIILTSRATDWLIGDDGNDTLYSMSGRDILSGGAGDDKLWGGPGADLMYGGDGADDFRVSPEYDAGPLVFLDQGQPGPDDGDTLSGNIDVVFDFIYTSDTLTMPSTAPLRGWVNFTENDMDWWFSVDAAGADLLYAEATAQDEFGNLAGWAIALVGQLSGPALELADAGA